ncbi:EF-hand domain-containing protein [Actinophytocola gossypii]|uniref:EF-hand domain-containing protein n=1 Tax=Actinophytocola gossypii TaxID=2812003 RepID=A0ABT2J377_9PSEU|nr:EF-hand domain-containing protein [Actinophytocola gossypii]MCT2582146.1 EF-hand domain-containing protein [Actinophytocola gossypii]
MTASMSKPNVQDRLQRRFQRWDSDDSGSLERSDFEREAASIAQRMGVSTQQAAPLKKALTAMFDDIARDGGANPAGPISRAEYDRAAEVWMGHDENVIRQRMRPMVEAIVSMADKDGSGTIDRKEFVAWISAVGAGDGQAGDAFDSIDTNGNGSLSADEVLQACVDFHLGRSTFELL